MEDSSSFEDTMNFGTDDVIVATYNKCGKFEGLREVLGGFDVTMLEGTREQAMPNPRS